MDLAKVDEDGITIHLPWDVLKSATIWCNALQVYDEETGDFHPPTVVDIRQWAKEVVHELNDEAENGDTLVTRAFDRAFSLASEQGGEGLRCWGESE